MSDDEADPELLELLRQSLGITRKDPNEISSETGVLKDAQFIYNNAIDVSIDMLGTKAAAAEIYRAMQQRSYSTEAWSQHELHPKPSEGFTDIDILNFVFTMDLLNFSFWSDHSESERFQVEYRSRRWTGYNSLVACLRRALDEDIPITTPRFWRTRRCSDTLLAHVFRSATAEQIPLLDERIDILREASEVLRQSFADLEEEHEDDLLDTADHEEAAHSSFTTTAAAQAIHSCGRRDDEFEEDSPYIESPRNDTNCPADVSQGDAAVMEATCDAANKSTMPEPEIGTQLPNIPVEQLLLDSVEPDATASRSETVVSHDVPEIEVASGMESGRSRGFTPSTTEEQSAVQQTPLEPSQPRPPHSIQDEDQALHQSTGHIHDFGETDRKPDHAVVRLVEQASHSAGKLVNLLAKHFPAFRDETRFDGRKVRILKRAQIFVADLWAAFNGCSLGEFHDIDHLTMFADYRVTQCLHSLGVLSFSPPLDHHIHSRKHIQSGHSWEVQLRGCSIWAVELIRREIVSAHPEAESSVNAVLLDFFLYDLAKEKEAEAVPSIPTHRTRSVWY